MKNFFLLILFFNLLISCQSAKDALTLQIKNNTDEFLIEKKSPLVLPPNFDELPEPNYQKTNELIKNKDIEKIINKNQLNEIKNNSGTSSIEKSILEKIIN